MLTFRDMIECMVQHTQGLVSDSELILALQLHPRQLEAVQQYQKLPINIYHKLSLVDWDDSVADQIEKDKFHISGAD